MIDPPNTIAQYLLRKFTENDLANVTGINARCLPENYTSSFFMDLYKSSPSTFIVAEHENGLAGYLMCRIESGLSELSRLRFARKGHVVSIAVLPEHRRRGVAMALMLSGISGMERARCTETYLEVRESNRSAISLYERLGYHIVRRAHGYYLDGETACVMGAKLPLERDEKQLLRSPASFAYSLGE